jgi:predicted metal-dependent hydrolase
MQQALPLEPEPGIPEPGTAEPEPARQPEPEPDPGTLNPERGTLNPPLVFIRHPRARRYVIRVDDQGIVRVTLPRWGSKREAREFAERERGWIDRQLQRVETERERRARSGANGTARIETAVERDLRARAKCELPARLLELAARHGLTVTRISIRNQRWRWGSCNRAGHICLNWRLVTMPASVRDYVLIHELMHLRRMDHSPKFWKLVAAACPEYQDARRWLRKAVRDN